MNCEDSQESFLSRLKHWSLESLSISSSNLFHGEKRKG